MRQYLIILIANICFLQFALGQGGANPNGNVPKVLTPQEIKENFRTEILKKQPNISPADLQKKVDRRYMDYSITESIKTDIQKKNPNITAAQLEKQTVARKKKIDEGLKKIEAGDKVAAIQAGNAEMLAKLEEKLRKMKNMTPAQLDQEALAIMNQANTSSSTNTNTAATDAFQNNLTNLSDSFTNSLPTQQTFDEIKQYYEGGKYLLELNKQMKAAGRLAESALPIGGGAQGLGKRVFDQSVSLGVLEVYLTIRPPFIEVRPRPTITNNKLKDKETRKIHNKILGYTLMRTALAKHVDKSLTQTVTEYRLRLQDEYTQNRYDDKRFSASGDRNVLIRFLTQAAISRQLDRTKFGITKNKKTYARNFRHSATPIATALRLASVNYSDIPSGERQMIYQSRRRLMTALVEEGGEEVLEHLSIPIVKYAMSSVVGFNKAKHLSQARKAQEVITKY